MDKATKDAIARRLERITEKGEGRLTPTAVVKDAKSKNSPLHQFIDWDDKSASHKYRLSQARKLIRSVTLEVHTTTKILAGPVYVRDPRVDAKEQGYVPVLNIKSERDLAYDIMRNELTKVLASLERARGIAGTLEMGEDLEELLVKTTEIEQRLHALAS